MLYNNKKVSTFVENQLPEHIRHNYTLFTKFLIYYYEYMEQSGNPIDMSFNYLKNISLDSAEDDYFERVVKQFVTDIPLNNIEDKKTLIKNMAQFYNSKGTEESFAFILNTLFGDTVEDGYVNNNRFLRWDNAEPNGSYTLNGVIVKEETITPYDNHPSLSIESDGTISAGLFVSFLTKHGETGIKENIEYSRYVIISAKVYIDSGTWDGMGLRCNYRNDDDSINVNKTFGFSTSGNPDYFEDLNVTTGTGTWVDINFYADMGYGFDDGVTRITLIAHPSYSGFGTLFAKKLYIAYLDMRPATEREITLGKYIDPNLPTVSTYYPKTDIHTLSTNNTLSDSKYIYDGEYYQNNSYVLNVSQSLYDAILDNKTNILELLHPIGKKIYLKNIDTNTLIAL